MSWKRRQAAKARVRELREAAEVVEAMEAATEAAEAERGFEVMNRSDDAVTSPTLLGSNDEALVWHPALGMCTVWQARAYDKARINNATYPDAAPQSEKSSAVSCEEPGAEHADKAIDIARAVIERDTEVEEPDAEEQQALAKIVEILSRLDERLTALEEARTARQALDAEVEALRDQPSLH